MPSIFPFRAIRPKKEVAGDVLLTKNLRHEGREIIVGENPHSFFHILNPVDDNGNYIADYVKSCETSAELMRSRLVNNSFIRDNEPALYHIELSHEDKNLQGIVCTVSAKEYQQDKIKRHEKTRIQRERQLRLFQELLGVHTTPVLLTYRENKELVELKKRLTLGIGQEVLYDIDLPGRWKERVWKITDKEITNKLMENFGEMENFYIADGHHRAACASSIYEKHGKDNKGSELFTAVLIPDSELSQNIYPFYRRLVDYSEEVVAELMEELYTRFQRTRVDFKEHLLAIDALGKNEFLIYTKRRQWELLSPKYPIKMDGIEDELDVSILQREILAPIFEIENPATDHRIKFGTLNVSYESLMERATKENTSALFLCRAPKLHQILKMADAHYPMPPKSTSFEPKMTSGLFIHSFKD